MRKDILRILLLAVGILLSMGCGHSQETCARPDIESSRHPDEPINIKLETYIGRFKKAEVTIGGESHPFLLDTGGGVTIIGSEVARLLGCEPYGQMTAFNLLGKRIDMKKCPQAEMKIGQFETVRELTFLDLHSLLPEGVPPISGLISLHTFENQAITLDLSENHLIIESEESLRKRIEGMEEMRIAFDRHVDSAILDIYVEIPTPKGPLWFILDSGNLAGFLINPHAFEQLGIKSSSAEGDGGDDKQNVELEFPGLGRVQTPVMIKDITLDGAISAEFMEKMVLTMDLGTQRMWGKFK